MTSKPIANPNVVLFYPRLGWMDAFVTDLPLSLIYVAHGCQQAGIEVRIVDQRVEQDKWRQSLDQAIDAQTVMVGFSVMSGTPILHALKATEAVRAAYPGLAIVWGGMHPTICPDSVMRDPRIDYLIRGLGSEALLSLTRQLASGSPDLAAVPGLGWRHNDEVRYNDCIGKVCYPPLDELNLEAVNMRSYKRFTYEEQVYSLFTSFGCPHQCRFCFAPIFWKDYEGRRWFPYPAEDVVAHVVKVVNRYNVGYISMLDENFFLDLKRAEAILRGILDAGVRVRWGIRGARIDDLDRMGDDFLELLQNVGVEQVMIGAESGSQQVLDFMKKGIRVEQTVRVNQKLARFPKLKPSYNFLSGLPTETVEDMFQSVDLILTLMKDNPNASFSGMNQLIPFPGSVLYDICLEHGHKEPTTLDEWAHVDTHYNDSPSPWLEPRTEKTLHAIQAALMFVDDKAERELHGKRGHAASRGVMLDLMFWLIATATKLYRPIARYRLKKHNFMFPIEYKFAKFGVMVLDWLRSRK